MSNAHGAWTPARPIENSRWARSLHVRNETGGWRRCGERVNGMQVRVVSRGNRRKCNSFSAIAEECLIFSSAATIGGSWSSSANSVKSADKMTQACLLRMSLLIRNLQVELVPSSTTNSFSSAQSWTCKSKNVKLLAITRDLGNKLESDEREYKDTLDREQTEVVREAHEAIQMLQSRLEHQRRSSQATIQAYVK